MHSEDDDFPTFPSSNSSKKLASLFEKGNVTTGGNSSLMYKAPKQPRSQKQQQVQQPSNTDTSGAKPSIPNKDLSLVIVVTVQAFKLENNEYKAQGKMGAALVSQSNYNLCQLILYKQKSEPLTLAAVNSQFWFTVQTNNYGTFYDKNKIMWSILFDSTDNAVEFITHIAIAKWNCEGKKSLFAQDLVVLEGDEAVEQGVLVDISCTVAFLSPDNKLEKKFESSENRQIRIPNNEPAICTWENMIIGMHVGCKRLIMLPATELDNWKQYSVDGSKNYCVLVTVLVNRIESLVESSEPKTLNLDSSVDHNVKAKTESIEDALTSGASSARASLISRMAKMGQATLPFKGARVPTCGISDSSEIEEDGLPASSSDNFAKTHINTHNKSNTKQIVSTQPTTVMPEVSSHQSVSPLLAVSSTLCSRTTNSEGGTNSVAMTRAFTYDGSLMQPGTFPNYSSAIDPQLSVFLSELRTHNTELRMNINRVSDKIDRVSDKVDNIDPVNKILEQLQIMEQNISSQFASMNKQNNEINIAMKKSGLRPSTGVTLSLETDDQYEQLKRENTDLLAALSQSMNKMNELQVKLYHLEDLKLELLKQLETEKENKKTLEKERLFLVNKLKDQLNDQEKSVKSWHAVAEKTASTIIHLEKKIEGKRKTSSIENEDDIKKIMRKVYKSLLDKFPHDSTVYSSSEIHSMLASVIKANTLEYLQSRSVSNKNTLNKSNEMGDIHKETEKEEAAVPLLQQGSGKLKNAENIGDQNSLSNNGIVSEKVSLTDDKEINDNVTSCADDSIKIEGENGTVGSNSQKVLTSSCKEIKDICNKLEETSEIREQSPCSSVKSNATNDTVDENWRSQPPPLLFNEEEKDGYDDWLKM